MRDDILATLVAEARTRADLLDPEQLADEARNHRPRGFSAALAADTPAVIAEIKRRSPSKGPLDPDLDPVDLATRYLRGGASAISILTEPKHFHGSEKDLRAVRDAVDLPVLRKDFIVDPVQVVESAAIGADAVLAIVAGLDDEALRAVIAAADDHGLDTLVEVHDAREIDRASRAGARIVGVNARNLRTFQVDLELVVTLRDQLGFADVTVAESGIQNREDVDKVTDAGYHAVLIGETLVRSADPEGTLHDLLTPVSPAP
ncbi:MAG: indole-3-glycerol phosphate synthase TrpC [Acidimicrobiia bacterium]|nr:indole-3-glycerol phosphate synthase TrpC [Acidimicrobiia bacterium]